MTHQKQTVWVVMHYEIMGPPDSPWPDSVQFHVSSSLEKAEEYIRSSNVAAHSWWQVHPHVLDSTDPDEGDKVHHYSHQGAPLTAAPTPQAIAAYRAYATRHPDRFPPHSPSS